MALRTIVSAFSKSITGAVRKLDDEIVINVAVDISKRLISIIEFHQAHFKILKPDEKGRLPPLSTVLSQEIDRYNKLLNIIHNSLTDLRKAIQGHAVMSEELEGVYWSFVNNTVLHL